MASVCVCVCVCVSIYDLSCILCHTHTHTHNILCVCVCVCLHYKLCQALSIRSKTSVFTDSPLPITQCSFQWIPTHTHTAKYTHTYTHAYKHTYIHTHIRMYTRKRDIGSWMWLLYIDTDTSIFGQPWTAYCGFSHGWRCRMYGEIEAE